MKIIVTGALGMLGADLIKRLRDENEVIGVTRQEFDVLKPMEVRDCLARVRPDWVVHCAAFTNVDGCEKDPDKAFRVNADGAANVAKACWGVGARMLYVSTDYVYDGSAGRPYTEADQTGPLNVYGSSKLKGEQEALKVLPEALVVRTSWLFGLNGPNFVEAILGQVGKKDELKVVADQVGSPTYTVDLADAMARLIGVGAAGIVNASNAGVCSWFEYAVKILELAGANGISVLPITTAELGRPAPRPAYSVLSKEKYTGLTGHSMRGWEDALRDYLRMRGVPDTTPDTKIV